jgi:hypothetical protein
MTPDRELARTPVQSGLSVRTSDWLCAQWLLLVKVASSAILLAKIVSRECRGRCLRHMAV